MLKTIVFILVAIVALCFLGEKPLAASSPEDNVQAADSAAQTAPQKPVEVGNKICPVSGERIDEKTKATYEYRGKIYNFCCAACIDEFKKETGKYLKKIEAEKNQLKNKQEYLPSAGHQHNH